MPKVTTLWLTVAAAVTVLATDAAIVSPASGTKIKPGATFAFEYRTAADYCVSSYNFTVWLDTQDPTSLYPSNTWARGVFLGEFALPNYPGNPYPRNLPPSNFTMPDFSISPGGFGVGSKVNDAHIKLLVLEEYQTCAGGLGNTIGFHYANLIYNATS
ncbi:hypothetical protein BU16DRAFT_565055 [Lophium mytilinum]|uniref:Uncharacterized protein n=1 Tax=Lophium mytilinum TaxID=390894 RepID=A0A6A6QGX0_9PEZI|nr:hypothetical protein BU16DRAFT_565055 [Lophium mytilinum]